MLIDKDFVYSYAFSINKGLAEVKEEDMRKNFVISLSGLLVAVASAVGVAALPVQSVSATNNNNHNNNNQHQQQQNLPNAGPGYEWVWVAGTVVVAIASYEVVLHRKLRQGNSVR